MTTYRILVPLDGSAASEAALAEVERIAVGPAEIHFLHIVPPLPLTLGSSSAGAMQVHDQALSSLESLRGRLPEMRGLNLIRTGVPADAILQVALELKIDLIAMCTHSRTGLSKCWVGSVAETVVRQTQLPVLLMRPGIPAPRTVLRRILVPLDGSEESLMILETVEPLAVRTGAEVVFLHVPERAFAPLSQRGDRGASAIPEDPERKLLALADRLGKSDLLSWQTIAEGDAVEEILDHARTLDADVIAMSTHARSGRERANFGSVAQAVLGRADRAVLLRRPVARAAPPRAGGYPRTAGRRWADPR